MAERQGDPKLEKFTQRIINIIQSIPSGTVMTYGQIAALAGSPRAARQVVRILHTMSRQYNLPWHRVVNAKGEIRVPDDESKMMQTLKLQGEGVEILDHAVVHLEKYQYHPNPDEISDG